MSGAVGRMIKLAATELNAVIEDETAGAQSEPIQPMEASAVMSQIDPMHVRIVEALLFAASEPLDERALAAALPPGTDMAASVTACMAPAVSRILS